MARKSFVINTEPHVAEIGETELLFRPEVMGDEYLDAYEELRETYKRVGIDGDDATGATTAQLREVTAATRTFLSTLMLRESAAGFASMRLPDRVLVELLEWSMEVYAGGERPTGQSKGSSPAPQRPGTRGRASSR